MYIISQKSEIDIASILEKTNKRSIEMYSNISMLLYFVLTFFLTFFLTFVLTFVLTFFLTFVYLIVVVLLIQSYDQRDVDFERAVVHGSKSRRHFCNGHLLFYPHHYFHFH